MDVLACFALCLLMSPQEATAPERVHAALLARRIAASAQIYERFMGRHLGQVSDLWTQPEDAPFWPDGGFWLGAPPEDPQGYDFRIERRQVQCSLEGIAVPIPGSTGGLVLPPSDALKKFYTAQIHLDLIRLWTEEILERTGTLPGNRDALPSLPADPWGDEYDLDWESKQFIVRVQSAFSKYVVSTEEERSSMEKQQRFEVREEERQRIRDLLPGLEKGRMEERERSAQEILSIGAPARPILQERLESGEVTANESAWIGAILDKLSALPSPWSVEYKPLQRVLFQDAAAADRACIMNLRQLNTFILIYMNDFGGALKEAPHELGEQFWLAFVRVGLLPRDKLSILQCPASSLMTLDDRCSYRGPAADYGTLDDDAAAGMCLDPAHGPNAIVLWKAGSRHIKIIPRESPEFQRALDSTKP